MSLKIKPKTETAQPKQNLDDGIYPAKLTEVKQFENQYGSRIGFLFTTEDGANLLRTAGLNLSIKSQLFQIVESISGEAPAADTECDLEALVGTKVQIVVKNSQGKDGRTYSNVDHIVRDKQQEED